MKKFNFLLLLFFSTVFVLKGQPTSPDNVEVRVSGRNATITWDTVSTSGVAEYRVYLNDSLVASINLLNPILEKYHLMEEKNGIVKIEAESIRLPGWSFNNSWSGFSGSGYMTVTDGYNNGSDWMVFNPAGIPPLEKVYKIRFRVKKAGNYRLDACYAMDNSESNDLWTRFTEDDNQWHKSGRIYISEENEKFEFFSWCPGPRYLEPGVHTAYVGPRSQHLALDYIVVYKSENNPIYETGDEAVEKYGYWLINAMNPMDEDMIRSAEESSIDPGIVFLENLPFSSPVHEFKVVSVDASGNESLNPEVLYIEMKDTISPTAPANLRSLAEDERIKISWDKSTDNDAVNYIVFMEDVILDTTDYRYYIFENLEPGETYNFSVQAIDLSGNKSDISSITASTTGGISNKVINANHPGLIVYPNPIREGFYIHSPDIIISAQLYNVTGRKVEIDYTLVSSNKVHVYKSSHLKSGNYIVRIITKDQTYSTNIMVE